MTASSIAVAEPGTRLEGEGRAAGCARRSAPAA